MTHTHEKRRHHFRLKSNEHIGRLKFALARAKHHRDKVIKKIKDIVGHRRRVIPPTTPPKPIALPEHHGQKRHPRTTRFKIISISGLVLAIAWAMVFLFALPPKIVWVEPTNTHSVSLVKPI